MKKRSLSTLGVTAGLALGLVLAACSGTGSPAASNPNELGPVVSGPNTGMQLPANAKGQRVPFDTANLQFVEPTTDEAKATGAFFAGQWAVAGGALQQNVEARGSQLSLRQYTGDAFGTPGGAIPPRYRMDITVSAFNKVTGYPTLVGAPLGIMGFAPFYQDETHFLMVTAKPNSYEVWAVDGQTPKVEWPLKNQLLKKTLTTPLDVNQTVSWAVEVDTNAQQARLFANGEDLGVVTHPMLASANAKVALLSNGNYVQFQDMRLYRY